MKIGIIGLGFVGLSLAAVLGAKKYSIIGVDSDKKKLLMIQKGKTPFYEPKLNQTLKQALKNKLVLSENYAQIVNECKLIFITVGTPQSKNGTIDLTMIKDVVKKISKHLAKTKNQPIIIIKSTVIPGTTKKIVQVLLEKSGKKAGKDFGLITNPEFLRESNAINDTLKPHIVVLGGMKNKYMNNLKKFYQVFYKNVPLITTNSQTAEMIKYTNNSFLATKISFINQIARICEAIPGANVEDVAKAIGFDPRIGNLFLNAGPGYGGSCLPKDVKAIINFSSTVGINPLLLNAVERINENQLQNIINTVEKAIGKIQGKTITVLGIAFKANTDDIRDSVSINLIKSLLKKGAKIKVHDPMAIENTKKIFKNKISYEATIKNALTKSDCGIIVTPWKQYSNIKKEIQSMRKKIIVDSRRLLVGNENGFNYYALGVGRE